MTYERVTVYFYHSTTVDTYYNIPATNIVNGDKGFVIQDCNTLAAYSDRAVRKVEFIIAEGTNG